MNLRNKSELASPPDCRGESPRLAETAPGLRLSMPEEEGEDHLQIRVYGDRTLPTLVYLPGLHGDWTLIGGFRRALAGRACFVEMTYPRTLTWSLDDYAAAIERQLAVAGIRRGWLLGESFGSQIAWALVGRKQFDMPGVILAGGFARYPINWVVRLAERLCVGVSPTLLTRVLAIYAKVNQWRYRDAPEVVDSLDEFLARRTDLDRRAAKHRLKLIALNDPSPVVCHSKVPLYVLTGIIDPIVPWIFVRPWLGRRCPALRDYRIVWHADHNVLGTAPRSSAELMLQWMAQAAV